MITARDVYDTSLQKKVNTAALVVAAIVAALVFPKSTWAAAGNTNTCITGTSCTIGEFLYDDSYNPLTTATCQITSRYPNGSLFLNATAMTPATQGDGWYSYAFTTPSTTGLYRTTIKCTTVDGQVLALDKSFEAKDNVSALSANDVAAATWGYSGRTLSSFGSLVTDIWNNATRTLTGANLSSGSIATKSNVEDLSLKLNSLSKTVDKFVNAPTIQHVIESDSLSSYNTSVKIEKTHSVANDLSINAQYLKSKAKIIDTRWDDLEIERILASLKSMQILVGEEKDSVSKNSIFGNANWITQQWGWMEADNITAQTKSIKLSLTALSKNLIFNGKSKEVRGNLNSLSLAVDKLYMLVGDSSLSSKQNNLFSKVNDTDRFARALDTKFADVTKLLLTWDANNKYLTNDVENLTQEVIKLNKLPKISLALIPMKKENPERTTKNKALGLLGIINANRKFLTQRSNSAFSSTWLELGSIVFKSIITNPSSTTTQTVPFKYALPKEVKKQDILEIDNGLSLHYDSDKNNYYISGTFDLAPNESKTVSVRVDDKTFDIPEHLIATLRKQADELSKPLKNTSYFAQGVTLKSDIDVSLDKALSLKSDASTPEEKIRSYRDAKIEIDSAKVKIEKLKEIVTTAGSVGTFFGFVGGTQTLAVWGMIIIMVAGFVFLTLYMRALRLQDTTERLQIASMSVSEDMIKSKGGNGKGKGQEKKSVFEKPVIENQEKPRRRFSRSILVGIIIIGVFGISGAAFSGITGLRNSPVKKQTVSKTKDAVVPQEKKVLGAVDESKNQASVSAKIIIIVPESNSISIHQDPSLASPVVITLTKSQEGDKLSQKDGWTKVSIKKGSETVIGWVDTDFTQDADAGMAYGGSNHSINQGNKTGFTVTVLDDLTGFLSVRKNAPNGAVIAKIKAGEKFPFIAENDGWVEIKISDVVSGWVSKKFVTVTP